MTNLRLWLAQNYGPLLATAVFLLMFGVYIGNHSAGLTVPVVTTAANKGVLLALIAMAQTLPVLTGGLDLSVGMILVMTNCIASTAVSTDPWPDMTTTGHGKPAPADHSLSSKMPSTSGIQISSSTRSGVVRANAVRAAPPSSATVTR